LNKEIEFQGLEIKLHEKRTKEAKFNISNKKEGFDEAKIRFDLRKDDLATKKGELDEIVAETQKEESAFLEKSEKAKSLIDERLVIAYTRLRNNAKNGLAVVPVDRDSCGGCFNKIPPQRQLDIQTKRKVIVCEHCGRILVPSEAE
jgi:predicted  nucleic acid-binding Zn-ribbon protein